MTGSIIQRALKRAAALPRRQRGLSLVELMVGLTIGLLLTVGLVGMIAGTSRSFAVQDDFARMQENGSLALNQLGDDIRMAGFYGTATSTNAIDPANGSVINTLNDCGSAGNAPTANWAVDTRRPMYGRADLTPGSVTGVFPCIAAANFQGGPILVVRRASGYLVPDPNADGNLVDAIAAQPNSNTTIYVQSEPSYGLLFRGSDYAALRASNKTAKVEAVVAGVITSRDAPIFEYLARVYYIRPCSRFAAAATTCTAAADGERPIPTLVRQELNGVTMVETPLVEGVERISFLYGVDADGNGIPDRFIAAPADADWINVVSVRVALLARSPNPATGYNDSGKTYDLDGDGVTDYVCTQPGEAATACSYKRKVFVQTFQMRNIAMRRGA